MTKAISTLALVVCSAAAIRAQATNGVTLAPTAMTVNYQIGTAALPAAQTLQVTTLPKALNFTVAISGAPFNAAWLLVSQSAGTSPASIKVETNPTGLAAGTYVWNDYRHRGQRRQYLHGRYRRDASGRQRSRRDHCDARRH